MFLSWLLVACLASSIAFVESQDSSTDATQQPSEKPGTCPAPYTNQIDCPPDARDLCSSDHECQGMSVKCCNLGCHKICIDPNDLIFPTTACPILPRTATCTLEMTSECLEDGDCPEGLRCCSDGCVQRCVGATNKGGTSSNPHSIKTTASSSTDKQSACPGGGFRCRTSKICIKQLWRCDGSPDCDDGSDEENCGKTNCSEYQFMCRSSKLCIRNVWRCDGSPDCDDESDEQYCESTTSSGVTTTTGQYVSKDVTIRTHEDAMTKHTSTKLRTTPTTHQKEDVDTTTAKQITRSQVSTEALQTPVNQKSTQVSTERENFTQKAVISAYPQATDKPRNRYDTKPGACPKIIRASCPRFTTAECIKDDECPGIKKCCSNGCYLECIQPEDRAISSRRERYKPGYCKSIQPSDVGCPQRNLCTYDNECPGAQKCCYHVCRWKICYDPMTKQEEDELFRRLHKRGDCPHIPKPVFCTPKPRKCNYDIDCGEHNDEKCCTDGCNNICIRAANLPRATTPVPVAHSQEGDIQPGLCPPYNLKQQCGPVVQDQCTCDSNCGNGLKCCFDGCKRVCTVAAEALCNVQADIVFLMDTSASIGLRDYNKEKQFVKDLAKIFRIRDGGSRAAVIIYNHQPTTMIRFTHHSNYEDFAQAVDRIPYRLGQTRIDKGLLEANALFLSNARDNVAKILIVLTDGKQTTDPDAMNLRIASQPLRAQGVQILAIGVGHNIKMQEIYDMVETHSHAFTPESFSALLKLSKTIAERACKSAESVCYQRTDLGFIIDSSDSISGQVFNQQKAFVKAVGQGFRIAAEGSRLGVMSYSFRSVIHFRLGQYKSNAKFNEAVDKIRHLRGKTRADIALRYAANSLFYYSRSGVPSVAVFISHSRQSNAADLESLSIAVQPLRQRGVRVIVVGVGLSVDRRQLAAVVQRSGDVIFANSYDELIDHAEKVIMLACSIPLPTSAPVTTFVPDPLCTGRLEVIFIMDSSRSIDVTEYEKEKLFVKQLGRILKVGSMNRAAVIIYSDDPRLVVNFNDYSNLQQFQDLVDRLPYIMQRTRIDKALQMASNVVKNAQRGYGKVAIVMTDGRQTRDPDAVELRIASRGLHDQGANVLAVGVGPEINERELRQIVHGDTSKVFTAESFDTLSQMVQRVGAKACSGARGFRTEPNGNP